MINSYIKRLEQIVLEMESAIKSGSHDISEGEYLAWVNFLKYVRPESNSLKGKVKDRGDPEFKTFSDLREIMMFAEAAGYPMWHIQPKFSEELIAEYAEGKLISTCVKKSGKTEEIKERGCIPEYFKDFTGKLYGTWREREREKPEFAAYDIDTDQDIDFLDRMKWLESSGLNIVEYVLFPTDKIPTTPMSKLAVFFQNYLSKVRGQGLKVDGIVIISNSPIIEDGSSQVSNRIVLSLA